MPTTTPVLLRGLVDDAAVFPPGNAPLADAVAAARRAPRRLVRRLRRAAARAGRVGGRPRRVLDVRDAGAVRPARCDPLEVVLVARPGADPATLDGRPRRPAATRRRVRVVGAELAWHDGWRDLGSTTLPLALEVPRGDGPRGGGRRRPRRRREGRAVVAEVPHRPHADVALARRGRARRLPRGSPPAGVPFKLTGGLHHAVRGTYEVAGMPEENHGVLNVLVATSAALAGAGQDEVAALLAVRDATALADLVAAWPDATAARVRAAFTAYGCCTVTDPLGELADLGLLARP